MSVLPQSLDNAIQEGLNLHIVHTTFDMVS